MMRLYESLWTRKQVAEHLQVSQKTIERLEKRGFIPRVEIPGGSIRYKPSTIQEYVDRWTKFRHDDPNSMVAFGGKDLRNQHIER